MNNNSNNTGNNSNGGSNSGYKAKNYQHHHNKQKHNQKQPSNVDNTNSNHNGGNNQNNNINNNNNNNGNNNGNSNSNNNNNGYHRHHKSKGPNQNHNNLVYQPKVKNSSDQQNQSPHKQNVNQSQNIEQSSNGPQQQPVTNINTPSSPPNLENPNMNNSFHLNSNVNNNPNLSSFFQFPLFTDTPINSMSDNFYPFPNMNNSFHDSPISPPPHINNNKNNNDKSINGQQHFHRTPLDNSINSPHSMFMNNMNNMNSINNMNNMNNGNNMNMNNMNNMGMNNMNLNSNGFQLPNSSNQFSPVLSNNNMNGNNNNNSSMLNFPPPMFPPFMPMFNQSFPFSNEFIPPPPLNNDHFNMFSPTFNGHPNMFNMNNMNNGNLNNNNNNNNHIEQNQQQSLGNISIDNSDGNILFKLLSMSLTPNSNNSGFSTTSSGISSNNNSNNSNHDNNTDDEDENSSRDIINTILNSTTNEDDEANEEEEKLVTKKIEKKRTLLPVPSPDKMKDITSHAYDIFEKSKCEENRGRGLLNRLQNLVSKTFPKTTGIKLHLFGSSANGMSLKGGDIDICMVIDNYPGGSDEIIEKLAEMLKNNNFVKILAIPTARVPIVKFKDPNTHLSCDICINNKLAIYNTNLVKDYSMIDDRMRPLVYVVKRWAKRRKINEPAAGTLSSYAYINMVISFLQSRNPPILPCLQELSNGVKVFPHMPTKEYGQLMDDVIVDGFNCKYFNDMSRLVGFGKANTESLGSLVFHFFQSYAREFSFMNDVVSIKTGHPIPKSSKSWETMLKKSHYWFSIEDPFEITHNLARVVNRKNLSVIISELNRAYKVLSKNGNLHHVCREYIEENN